jgi:intracellular sulfur oxidation DsrE/DsrF family protein
LKEMVQHAYHQPATNRAYPTRKLRTWWAPLRQSMPSLATCMLLLLLGWGSGWLMSSESATTNAEKVMGLFQASQSNEVAKEAGNIIVHVSNSNPVRLKTALDETESLLAAYKRENRAVKVEIIAAASGMNLLRSDVSPYAKRIASMQAKYPNLDFLACSQTISKLQKKGVTVHLLPHTVVAPSAVEQINKRLLQGWDYVRV